MDRFNVRFIVENQAVLALISFHGINVRPSTGVKAKIDHWHSANEVQFVKKDDPDHKKKNDTLRLHLAFLSDLLKELEYSEDIKEIIKQQYNIFKKPHFKPKEAKKETGSSRLLDYYREWVFDCSGLTYNKTEHTEFIDQLKELISNKQNHKKLTLSKNTLKNYRNTYHILMKFEQAYQYPLLISTINFDFERKFKYFILEDLEQDLDTHCKHVGIIKTFCKWLYFVKGNKQLPLDYQVFARRAGKNEDIPSLDPEEMLQLHNVCFVDKQLEKARLIFLALCSTAVHISDYNEKLLKAIQERDLSQEYIELRRKKTGALCIIPFYDNELFRPHYYTSELIAKFGKLPIMNGSALNDYLAEIQQELGLTRIRITSKVGRKTFASLQVYHLNKPYALVMKVTGHTTYRSFEAYLGIQKKDIVAKFKEKNT